MDRIATPAGRPPKAPGIYCIRNAVSGRVYVGSAIALATRLIVHEVALRAGKHHSIRLQRSWAKHGAGAFAFTVLELVEDVAGLLDREQHWIDRLDAASPKLGFNVLPKAGSPLGTTHTEETRQKISAANKGKPKSAETRARQSAAAKARLASDEARQRLSDQLKAGWAKPGANERLRAAQSRPENMASKLAGIAAWHSVPGNRERRAEATRKAFADPAARERLREGCRASWRRRKAATQETEGPPGAAI